MPSIFQVCVDHARNPDTCTGEFEITEGEQEFYQSKTDASGKPYDLPKRCKSCRLKKKERFAQQQRAA